MLILMFFIWDDALNMFGKLPSTQVVIMYCNFILLY